MAPRTPMSSSSALPDFYLSSGTDGAGRTFNDVLALDFDALEFNHDFIQWIFPLRTASAAVPGSPVLDDAAVEDLRQSSISRERALRALRRMLAFYGLELDASDDEDPVIERSAGWDVRRRNWLRPGNHNFLRLTRILTSLRILGLPQYSRALFECLKLIYRDHAGIIGDRTFAFWKQAVA